MKLVLTIILTFLINLLVYSQNTIGIIKNDSQAFNGYTLFTAASETYLIDNCGKVVNQWSSLYPPGNAVYLLENGNLLRASKIENPDIDFGGAGGRIELYNWEGALTWEYNYSTNLVRQHHDIYPLPNGNILMLAVTVMSNSETLQLGRDPGTLSESVLYNEQILELEPTGSNAATIIWEWNVKDHLIQDFDNSKSNFGIIADNPQLLNINYIGGSLGNANWMHVNSIQYYSEFDQIVISSRLLNEIYIIDHSTTTAEAASHSGGTYGKGGDILYRWGNPQSYNQGVATDQKLFGQHYSHYIPNGLLDAGKIILFNNGFNREPDFSEVFIISPPTDSPGIYSYTSGTAYGPSIPDYTYLDSDDPTNFYSAILSGAQRLPNDNILICEGTSGRFFEIDINGDTVWEYINPVGAFGILTQGDNPAGQGNTSFRATKYDPNYEAFTGRDLTPGNNIEFGEDQSNCNILNTKNFELSDISIYPNPVDDYLTLNTTSEIDFIELYDVLGNKILSSKFISNLNFSNIKNGMYFLRLYYNNTYLTKKIIKK